jgi:hypothetical protein
MKEGDNGEDGRGQQGAPHNHEVSPRVSLLSPRVSGIDYHVADGFRPDISPPVSPIGEDSKPGQSSRPTFPPVSGHRSIRSSILKEPGNDEIVAGPSRPPFDPNTSRFNRSSSSASNSPDSANSYRDRISRISFSYPRRSPSSAGQASPSVTAAHPYALYRQTTFEEADETENVAQPMPVGFYGRPSAPFTRRTGPDGEELDVVGPDGHLEQLPPYTRYPMAGPVMSKAGNDPVSPMSSASHTSSPQIPFSAHSVTSSPMVPFSASAQASPLVPQESIAMTPLAPLVPQQSLLNLQNLHSVSTPTQAEPYLMRSHNNPELSSRGSGNSRGLQSSASSLVEAKPDEPESLKKKKKKKQKVICGVVPIWAVLLAALIGVFLAIVAGGVIGGLLSQQKGKQKDQ